MKLDITSLEKELRAGKIRPVYMIVGEESYIARAAQRLIREKVCGDRADDLSYRIMSATDGKLDNIVDDLKTVPFLGSKILVVIRDGEKIKKSIQEGLVDYVSAPVDTSVLVVIAEKFDGRSKLMQMAGKVGAIIECKPLYASKIPYWINMELKRSGKQISQEAARFMADMIGSDLGQIAQAIDRVSLYVGDKTLIELSDIEHAIAETQQRTIFELTDAVGQRSMGKALAHLHNILENGGAPVLALNMLARHFRILSKAKEISGRITDKAEIAKYLGVNPFFAANYMSQANNFSRGELRNSFRTLHKCDRSIKSSRIPKQRAIEKALFSIIKK